MKKLLAIIRVALMAISCIACAKEPTPVNTKTCSYQEMVDYLTAKGFISKDAKPVDINKTEGYVTDNTGGELPFADLADKAEDYDGLYLFWWDGKNNSQLFQDRYENMIINGNTIVVMGGACIMSVEEVNGYFAIAFKDGYAQKDTVLKAFKELPNQ